MKAGCWVLAGAIVTVLAHRGVAVAADDFAACDGAGVSIGDSPSAAWRQAVLELCRELPSLPDVDRSASVHLSGLANELSVSVWLHDGRHAERRIRSPEALRDVVEALVLLPPPRRPAPLGDVASYQIAASAPDTRAPDPTALHVELGGGVVGRTSGTPRYLSLGGAANAGVRWGSWLFGVQLRFEPWTRVSAGYLPRFEMSTAGLSFVLGRRVVAASGLRLDVALTTTLASEAQSVQPSQREISGAAADVRVGALARASFGSSSLRLALSLDAEVSPARIGREIRAADELPPLPSNSLGLQLGVLWFEP